MHRGSIVVHSGNELWFNRHVSSASTLSVYRSTGPPLEDLAREAWLLDRAADGEISVLLTSWDGPVVVLGYAQKPEEADLEWCRVNGIPVLRRLTGGTGVIHQGDLGVGLALPEKHPWAKGIVGLYGRFLDALAPALRSLDSEVSRLAEPSRANRVRSPVCFLDQLSDTLAVGGKKAVGCAQTRRRGTVLVHAAILLGLDAELYSRVFGIAEEEIRSGLAPALPGADWRKIGDAIVEGLSNAVGLESRSCTLEPVPDRYLEPYRMPRWSPVP
jgi:lipoate-protein ligase A